MASVQAQPMCKLTKEHLEKRENVQTQKGDFRTLDRGVAGAAQQSSGPSAMQRICRPRCSSQESAGAPKSRASSEIDDAITRKSRASSREIIEFTMRHFWSFALGVLAV